MTRLLSTVCLVLATVYGSAAAAAVQFTDITHASLVQHGLGTNAFIEPIDDDLIGSGLNPFGAASYVLLQVPLLPPQLGFVVGSTTVGDVAFGAAGAETSQWTRSALVQQPLGETFTTDIAAVTPHRLAFNFDRTVSLEYRQNNLDFGSANTQVDLMIGGYTIFNQPGRDDPGAIPGIDSGVAAYMDLLKTLVPGEWTQIVLTVLEPTALVAGTNLFGSFATLYNGGTLEGIGAAYTSDPAALAFVPLPGAWLGFAGALIVLRRARRRTAL